MKLDGDLIWTSIRNPQKTSLWLNGARIKKLRDDRESRPAPGDLHVDGLIYQELTLHEARTDRDRELNSFSRELKISAIDRIEWLKLQPAIDKVKAQAWIQLANLLNAKGDNAGSRRVIFEMRRYQAGSRWVPFRWWKAHLEKQPFQILSSILLLTVIGSCIFTYAECKGTMAPTNSKAYIAWSKGRPYESAYPRFNPIIYSLENDLPLVRFGQDDKWAPDPSHRRGAGVASYKFLYGIRVFLILAGWVQATFLASAIGSRFKT